MERKETEIQDDSFLFPSPLLYFSDPPLLMTPRKECDGKETKDPERRRRKGRAYRMTASIPCLILILLFGDDAKECAGKETKELGRTRGKGRDFMG